MQHSRNKNQIKKTDCYTTKIQEEFVQSILTTWGQRKQQDYSYITNMYINCFKKYLFTANLSAVMPKAFLQVAVAGDVPSLTLSVNSNHQKPSLTTAIHFFLSTRKNSISDRQKEFSPQKMTFIHKNSIFNGD